MAQTPISSQLDELFDEWEAAHKSRGISGFARDGIIDEKQWGLGRPKVLLLAKETNNFDGDLRELIRNTLKEEKKYPGWKAAGTWAYCVHNRSESPVFAEAEQFPKWSSSFLSSALLNLKKSKGGGSSDMKEIMRAAEVDRDFINRELKIIAPDVVICCGTFPVAEKIVEGLSRQRPIDADGNCYSLRGVLWINHCHFGAHFPVRMMYYTLQSIVHRAPCL